MSIILSAKDIRKWREIMDKSLFKKSVETIDNIISQYPKTQRAWNLLSSDPFISSLWDMSDYIAVTKMGYNAHGDIHAKIVAANALKMLDLLLKVGVQPDINTILKETTESGNPIANGDEDDAHLIVLLSSLLHDIGNQVNRSDHNLHSTILVIPILDKILATIYPDERKRGVIRGFILHSIYTHMENIPSYTLEASLVKVADGTDMTKGRGRTPFEMGNVNIHCVSAMSIGEVEIAKGKEKPIGITINMTNSAGVFQVEEILYKKLVAGVASKYVEIAAQTVPEKASIDERIVYKITVEENKFVHTR
ncbi:MAG: phosphohydrolase [Candidatus Bathyarchaeota archaeon]|nr:MAG: phosphohydrolase [Candidatus Bathyarchaeota archaeon]